MKKILFTLPMVIMAATLAQPGWAQGANASGRDEYQRNGNVPAPKTGTSESRSTERKARRAAVKATAKAGGIPDVGEDWGNEPPRMPEGTHATRSAERKANRAEIKQSLKAGTFPVTTEADVGKVPTTTR